MDLQALVNQFKIIAGVYAFDILPDGTYSEIRIMAINEGKPRSLCPRLAVSERILSLPEKRKKMFKM